LQPDCISQLISNDEGDETMKSLLSLIFVVLSLVVFSSPAVGQEQVETELEPRTKLEAFQARKGMVIIKGFSRIGVAPGLDGTSIEVESREFRDAGSSSREYGITIEVREAGNTGRRSLSYIDYEELDPLLKGLEYLSKIDNSVTQLTRFEADYRTKGDLVVSVSSGRGGVITLAISGGGFRPATSFFRLEDLKVIRGLIIEAKNQLDAIQQK
jgi:hypothetical protein